jgi:hypothetical protein
VYCCELLDTTALMEQGTQAFRYNRNNINMCMWPIQFELNSMYLQPWLLDNRTCVAIRSHANCWRSLSKSLMMSREWRVSHSHMNREAYFKRVWSWWCLRWMLDLYGIMSVPWPLTLSSHSLLTKLYVMLSVIIYLMCMLNESDFDCVML